MPRVFVSVVMMVVACSITHAQNVNLMPETAEEKTTRFTAKFAGTSYTSPLEMAVPLGATAGLTSDAEDNADVGAILGFQIFKRDEYFLAALFSYSGADTISGDTSNFGAFLLSPSTRGNAFYFSGNWVTEMGKGMVRYGPAGRLGLSRTSWTATIGTAEQTVDGFVAYVAPTFLLMSKSLATTTGSNEYQFSLEVGPSLRLIGGDLAQDDAFLGSANVLGSSDHSYLGWEVTFAARLNFAQPFVRLSHFNSDATIPGFSGTQAIIGLNVLSPVFRSKLNDD